MRSLLLLSLSIFLGCNGSRQPEKEWHFEFDSEGVSHHRLICVSNSRVVGKIEWSNKHEKLYQAEALGTTGIMGKAEFTTFSAAEQWVENNDYRCP